jgi:hypothetical protein
MTSAIRDTDHLEELLSEPSLGATQVLGRLDGDLVLLGVGGKMGPTLARMARRASDQAGAHRRVIGVARFSQPGLEERLRSQGIETIRCDLLDPAAVAALPPAANVIVLAGMKFGTTGQEALTWAQNTYLPALVSSRYRGSRLVAFSTGNVYGLAPVALGGSRESDPLQPVGEYACSCVGRERLYEYFSRTLATPTALVRLNYANELRYGVLVDVAHKVQRGEPVEVTMGHVNALWQGDANAMALCSLAHVAAPPRLLNLAGPELLSVRRVAEEFGRLLDRPVSFRGQEAADALLSNAQEGHRLFGYPRVCAQQMIHWIADWVHRGGASLDRPTHFEDRAGRF